MWVVYDVFVLVLRLNAQVASGLGSLLRCVHVLEMLTTYYRLNVFASTACNCKTVRLLQATRPARAAYGTAERPHTSTRAGHPSRMTSASAGQRGASDGTKSCCLRRRRGVDAEAHSQNDERGRSGQRGNI